MEKKEYIKPETMVEILETEVMMLTQSNPYNEEGGDDSSLSIGRNNRRGTWGNLWYTEQE